MHRALESAIGLPRRLTSASWMLAFLMPAEVRSNFMMPLRATVDDRAGRKLRFGAARVANFFWTAASNQYIEPLGDAFLREKQLIEFCGT
jgi:hypothetical protein